MEPDRKFIKNPKDGILGHQFNQRLETFAPCFSLILLRGFKEAILFSGFKNPLKKSAKQENSEVYS
jgi:hypothetical protein